MRVVGTFPNLSPLDRFLLSKVKEHPRDVARIASEEFKVTRQAVNQRLRRLVERGLLRREGHTRAARHELAILGRVTDTIPITADLAEDTVWRDRILGLVADVSENVRDICQYGFTEMLNNAKDHSGSPTVTFEASVSGAEIVLVVVDEGIGIFRKIKEECGLEDERHAVLELTKGKLTTDPERHTGEGVFFTSRMLDTFAILSGDLYLGCQGGQDWLLRTEDFQAGTAVRMQIDPFSARTVRQVFDRYATEQDDYAFRRTHIVVALAKAEGEKLISRSQAKRIMARVERFREVVLDFEGIDSIGPAFADEMFRVFSSQHPHVRVLPIRANQDVTRMISRALTPDTPRPERAQGDSFDRGGQRSTSP